MKRIVLAAVLLLAAAPVLAQEGEEPVEPYVVSDANAGAAPFPDQKLFEAFHGQAGIDRIVEDLIKINDADPRIEAIFKASDHVRLRRMLKEHFCYLLAGPCAYTGRDMKTTHKDHGIQTADFNALVENLQTAMDREGVPFAAQNRFLAKLAPLKRDVVER